MVKFLSRENEKIKAELEQLKQSKSINEKIYTEVINSLMDGLEFYRYGNKAGVVSGSEHSPIQNRDVKIGQCVAKRKLQEAKSFLRVGIRRMK
jgi:hypothetical protein